MPTIGANRVYFFEGIESTVDGSVLVEAVVCPAIRTCIIHVFGHPNLVADFYGLVNFSVARID